MAATRRISHHEEIPLNKHFIIAAAALPAALPALAGAQLVDFRFDGTTPVNEAQPYSGGSTSVDPSVDLDSGLQVGSGLNGISFGGSNTVFAANGISDGSSDGFGRANAQAQDEFIDFTVSPAGGGTLDLAGGSVVFGNLTAIGSSGATFNTLGLTSSLDNFAAELDTDSQQFPSEADPDAPTSSTRRPTRWTSPTSPRSSRSAGRSPSAPSSSATSRRRGGGGFVLDDRNDAFVQLNGAAGDPIPEPASAACCWPVPACWSAAAGPEPHRPRAISHQQPPTPPRRRARRGLARHGLAPSGRATSGENRQRDQEQQPRRVDAGQDQQQAAWGGRARHGRPA